jgi:hypothetical protein
MNEEILTKWIQEQIKNKLEQDGYVNIEVVINAHNSEALIKAIAMKAGDEHISLYWG